MQLCLVMVLLVAFDHKNKPVKKLPNLFLPDIHHSLKFIAAAANITAM